MKKTIVLGFSVLLLWSCNNPGKTTSSEETEDHIEAHSEHHAETHMGHHSHESSQMLELNNGERWIVNDEMKPFVKKQEELLNRYIESGNSDHTALADQLQEQNQLLIESCTMTGKSHDELHKWLHPYMALLARLNRAETKEDADRVIAEIEESLETYHAHFK